MDLFYISNDEVFLRLKTKLADKLNLDSNMIDILSYEFIDLINELKINQ